jgi:primosomal protein N' (replication factor Y) (superfamily II helicase)
MPKYASVVFDIAIDRQFDYLIPPDMEDRVKPGVRVYVPFRSRRLSAYVTSVSDRTSFPSPKAILSVRDAKPVVSELLLKLAEWIAAYYSCSLSAAIRCIVPTSVRKGHKAKLPLFVQLNRERCGDRKAVEELGRRAPRQARLVEILLQCEGPVLMQELLKSSGAAPQAVRALEKKGFATLTRQRVYRDPWEGESILPTEHLPPTPEQRRAIERAAQALAQQRFSVILLHGVTGSGKTEVYLQAIDKALKSGRGAIVLVPEISLTPQTVEGFKARFAENVAVLHSRLSLGERLDEWEKLRDGKARVVVGARSAIFAPVQNCGLIVVDEEHERTYKQEETPRYHARDVAVMRGKIENAVVILGSATPSVESYRNALTGKYALFHLPRRIEDRALPTVTIVDMKEEIKRVGRMTFFSRRLLTAMEERLEKREQVMLFLNRRGFSPVMICGRCGYVHKCPNCSIALTTHDEGEKLLCHLCGFTGESAGRCPRCRTHGFRFPGLGTQKLELMVSKLFPDCRVGRMDSDSMTGKGAHAETLKAFRNGEIQVLLGTQMIAKGLHFPNVTLVGVISADTALNLPDFRAAEYTFQLLTQVAGRAGRGEVHGEVIVQTYAPNHPAIMAARSQDYESFYRQEIPFREELGYPPFTRFIIVTVRGRSEGAVKWISNYCARTVRELHPPEMEVRGPAPSPIARAKGYYRWQIIFKGESVIRMNGVLKEALGKVKPGKGVQIVVDADPISML